MPEIQPSLPSPANPPAPAALAAGSLPDGLKPGESLAARVLAQVSPGRYALSIGGREVTVSSALTLSPGDQLQLVVRQTGTRTLMDLVPLGHASGIPAVGAADAPAASAGQAVVPGAPKAEAGLRGFLARGAPLGETLAESLRAVAALDVAGGAGPATGLAVELRALVLDLSATAEAGQASGGDLAGTAASLPDRLAGLLAAVEGRLAEAIRALPEVAALGALAELLDSLQTAPTATGPGQTGGASRETAELLQKLLAALAPSGRSEGEVPQLPQLPAELRSALAALPERELSTLRQLVAERESAALGASPQVAALTGAHRALAAAQDRLDAARLLGLAASKPGQSFSYLELPVQGGPGTDTARLRVLVRGEGDAAAGRGSRKGGKGTVRAILDLDLSALGQVRSELVLSGRNLAVRLELPDRERSGFVASELDGLKERLAARGLDPSLSASVAAPRSARARAQSDEDLGEASAEGGLDLWA